MLNCSQYNTSRLKYLLSQLAVARKSNGQCINIYAHIDCIYITLLFHSILMVLYNNTFCLLYISVTKYLAIIVFSLLLQMMPQKSVILMRVVDTVGRVFAEQVAPGSNESLYLDNLGMSNI